MKLLRSIQNFKLHDGRGFAQRAACTLFRCGAVTGCDWTHRGTNPTSEQNCYLRMKTVLRNVVDFSYRIRKGAASERLARKALAGTRPNEIIIIVLGSAQPRKAHPARFLHRRSCPTGSATLPATLPAPTAAPASSIRQHLRDLNAAFR